MEQQLQLKTMLTMEKHSYSKTKSHPQRRFIADGLNKLNDDEKMPDDIFALTMSLFDRFLYKSSSILNDRRCQLIALSCFNLAKKLRTNTSINNENEQTSLILLNENYSIDEIFNTEQEIVQTLDWDLSLIVPHDYLPLILQRILPDHCDEEKIRLHVQILLSLAICELNTLNISPSLLLCACLQATIEGLSLVHDGLLSEMIECYPRDLLRTQRLIEQFFQSCLQEILPLMSKPRRCLAPIETHSNTQSSPRVK